MTDVPVVDVQLAEEPVHGQLYVQFKRTAHAACRLRVRVVFVAAQHIDVPAELQAGSESGSRKQV